MANWSKNKVLPEDINGNNEFTRNDNLAIDELNAMVNNSFYAVDFAEAMADSPDISEIDGDGTPSVEIIDNVKNGKTYKKFKFKNLKGEKSTTGTLAGYDLTIRTQEEFDTFIESIYNGTCIANSVLFVGNGGKLEFSTTSNILLPITLYRIDGINNAIIRITTTNTGSYSYGGVFGYSLQSKGFSNQHRYSMSNISIIIEGTAYMNSFYICTGFDYVINCNITATTNQPIKCFSSCFSLINCYVELGTTSENSLCAFEDCSNLLNCSANYITGMSGSNQYFIDGCSYVSNCSKGNFTTLGLGTNIFIDSETVG